MLNGKVTTTPTFIKQGENPFTTAPDSAYYYDAVLWAVDKGVTNGTNGTALSPDATCTREIKDMHYPWSAVFYTKLNIL